MTAVTRPSLRSRITAAVAVLVLRLQASTWRVRRQGFGALDAAFAAGRPLLLAFWHGSYVPLFVLLAGYRGMVFTSRSRRGEVIAEICRRFGYHVTELGYGEGEDPYATMRDALDGEPAGGVAVDGPLGPYHVVKRGAVQLASELGRPLFPVAVAASRVRLAAGRWDRMTTPRAFCRVAFVAGEPLEVPSPLAEADLAAWQERLGVALAEADRTAVALLGG